MNRPVAVATASAEWSQLPERSNPLTLRFMRWFALSCGRRAARTLLHPIALYFLLTGGPTSRWSAVYLERVLGRRPRFADRYRHVHAFAATLLDRVYLLNDRFDLFDIRVIGDEVMRAAVANPQPGLFMFGAHMGSFEAVRALGRDRTSHKIFMVMYEENARKINQTLAAINPALSRDIVALGRIDSMLRVDRLLADGCIVGVLADRSLGASATRGKPVTMDLLGRPAQFGDGPFRLAAVLRRPVIFMAGIYRGGNRYDIHFVPIADFSHAATGTRTEAIRVAMLKYRDVVESLCRDAPFNWFNFHDFWNDKPR
ncbi:acyltransferase [soil metagenome]